MISRLTSEARIPSWPIEMPSLTAIVTNSSGKPPASRTPSLDRLASRSSGTLHGVTSFQLDATPTCALPQSASVIPTARSMARAGARSIPSVTSWLRGFMFSVMARSVRRTATRAPACVWRSSGTFGAMTDVGSSTGPAGSGISRAGARPRRRPRRDPGAATPEWTVHDVIAHLVGHRRPTSTPGTWTASGTEPGPPPRSPSAQRSRSRSSSPSGTTGAAAVRGRRSRCSGGPWPRSPSPTSGTTSRTSAARSASKAGVTRSPSTCDRRLLPMPGPATSPRPGSRRCGCGPASTSGSSATASRARPSRPSRTSWPGFICGRRTADAGPRVPLGRRPRAVRRAVHRRRARRTAPDLMGTPMQVTRRSISAALADGARGSRAEIEALGYDGVFTFEGPHDPFFPLVARGRAQRAARARHRDRDRVRPQPDEPGAHRVGPADALEGSGDPRARVADQAAHREAVLDAVVAPGGADARARARDPGDLGDVAGRHAAAVRGRVLPAHADDAVLHARSRASSAPRGSSSPGSAPR